MKITIYEPLQNAKRIKIGIPYENLMMREAVKKMNGSFWHSNQKLWSLVNTQVNFNELKHLSKGDYIIKKDIKFTPIPSLPLNQKSIDVLNALEKVLVLKHYGASSIRTYKKMLRVFLAKFMERDLTNITKEDIEGFVYELIQKNRISENCTQST
jgi:integrase/recombinase XerD